MSKTCKEEEDKRVCGFGGLDPEGVQAEMFELTRSGVTAGGVRGTGKYVLSSNKVSNGHG